MEEASHSPFHELVRKNSIDGIEFHFFTTPGGYHPLHWHEELEILFPLNGRVDITIGHSRYPLLKKHAMVIDACQIHSTYSHDPAAMFLCIHLSKEQLTRYQPGLPLYSFDCIPTQIPDRLFPEYLQICQLLESLTRLYIQDSPAFLMEAEGLILQVFARLIRSFAKNSAPSVSEGNQLAMERIRTIITYVEEQYQHPISLQMAAEQLHLGRESFCRFFKKNMGLSFLQYVNEVRLTHVYRDLIETDAPIARIMEENGLTSQKLFNRSFKAQYGCTPSDVRAGKVPSGLS